MNVKSILSIGSLTLLGMGAFSLIGCEDVESTKIDTSAMYARFSAVATGDGTTEVLAELRVGGPFGTYVLAEEPEDRLTASRDGVETGPMSRISGPFNEQRYSRRFSTEAVDTTFKVTFERSEKVPAPDSSTTLPAPFVLNAPTEGSTLNRSLSTSISWFGGTELTNYRVDGECIQTFEGMITPTGPGVTFSLPPNTVMAVVGRELETCTATLTVSRQRMGTVDPAYEGGQFIGSQQRFVRFESAP